MSRTDVRAFTVRLSEQGATALEEAAIEEVVLRFGRRARGQGEGAMTLMRHATLRRDEGHAMLRRDEGSASPVLAIVVAVAAMMAFGPLVPDAWLDADRACCGDQPASAGKGGAILADKKAGADYGVPRSLLAGIGKVETGHGTSRLPGVRDGESRYDPADAIPAAAKYLKHNGAPERTRTAVYAYNHSGDYVDLVLNWADRYEHGGYATTGRAGTRTAACHRPDENR
ncbi:hypothetical protein [Actinomadura sp. 6N118]|uniref:hypothetical protein n=1 Tax=Actinomadura sp. 6N118 TaxID=3375151 RepID=UPI003799BC1B